MKRRISTGICLAILGLALNGCAPKRIPTAAELSSPGEVIEKRISESAALVHHDLQQLQRIRLAGVSSAPHYKMPKSGPLAQKITIKFTGEPHKVVDTIAKLIGYDYRTIGKRPTPPKIVSVDVVGEPALKVLEDIALQLGEKAGVGVEPGKRLLTVDYQGID